MPSIREPRAPAVDRSSKAGRNAEFSGSTTATRVARPR
jgi:hypothetical protein